MVGKPQDSGRRGIGVQAIARVIYDQYSIENVLENGREFAIGVTKSLVRLSMFVAKVPERIDVQECREAQSKKKQRNQARGKYGMVVVSKE
jgi:hypothetical protein